MSAEHPQLTAGKASSGTEAVVMALSLYSTALLNNDVILSVEYLIYRRREERGVSWRPSSSLLMHGGIGDRERYYMYGIRGGF